MVEPRHPWPPPPDLNDVKFRDVEVGISFYFNNKLYHKTSDMGEFFGFFNAKELVTKEPCHINFDYVVTQMIFPETTKEQ